MSRLLELHFVHEETSYRNYDELLAGCDNEIANNPQNPDIYNFYLKRGEAKRKLGDLIGAINDFTTAINHNCARDENYMNFFIYLMRGIAKFDLHELEEARQDIDRARMIDPIQPHFFCEQSEYDTDTEYADNDKIVMICPEWPLAYLARAAARYDYEGTDHPHELISDLITSLELMEDEDFYSDAVDYIQFFIEIISIGTDGEVSGYEPDLQIVHMRSLIEDWTGLIAVRPDWSKLYHERGYLRIEVGDYQGAIEDYDVVIKNCPQDCIAYNNRGEAKFRLHRLEEAREDYNRAVALCPDKNFAPYGDEN